MSYIQFVINTVRLSKDDSSLVVLLNLMLALSWFEFSLVKFLIDRQTLSFIYEKLCLSEFLHHNYKIFNHKNGTAVVAPLHKSVWLGADFVELNDCLFIKIL